MCKFCEFGKRGKFKGRTPDFLILQDRFAVKIEKDEPYVGDYGLTVSDNEDECEFTVAINFCPKCGRKLTEEERKQAELLLPVLPKGWYREEQEWMAVVQAEKRRQSKRKKL